MNPLDLNIFDSNEEIYENEVVHRQPNCLKIVPIIFEEYDELEFFKRFRLQKQTCMMVLNAIEERIRSTTNRNNAISPESKLLLTLRFYATGSMLTAAGDFIGISKTFACNIVTQVTQAIASLRGRYIKFPEPQANIEVAKQEFYCIAKFPHVIGAIDCTHIRIQSPGGNEAEWYRNRKGYFSWNV